MAFLTPLFLIGLLAAAIPIAIHLIRREKPPKIVFSTLRFIKTTTRKLVLFQQLQQWLLLLLRSAVICLLVIAFARPLFDQTIARMLDAEPESAVILLDVSLSMQYGDTFDRAQRAVSQLLDGMGAGDEASIITFASGTVSATELTTDLSSLRARMDTVTSAGYDRVRFFPALRLANEMLESSRYLNRHVYLVSDFQANGLAEGDAGWTLAPGVSFTGIDVGTRQTRNLVLTDVRSPAQLIEDDGQYNILARVRSTGTEHIPSAEVMLRLDGEVVAREIAELADRSEAVVTLPVQFGASGSRSGEIILAGDDFQADNTWYFTVDVQSRIRVLVVNGAPSPNWYADEAHWLTLALQGMGSSPFVVQTVDVPRFDSNELEQTDVVVLLNVGDMPDAPARALIEYVERGGRVLFAPGDQVRAERFNAQFGRIAPAQLQGAQVLNRNAANDYLVIAEVDRRHPALQPLDLEWNARFEGYWSVLPEQSAEVLMRFDNAMPALLERPAGEGSTMLFTSSMDLAWSNLPLQSLFVPFVHETLRYMVQPVARQRSYTVGSMIDLSPELGGGRSTLSLQEANGNLINISSENPYYAAVQPGLLSAGTENAAWYAVNIDPAASDMARVAPTLIHDRIINPDTTPQQSREVRAALIIAEREEPQRLWWWILSLVLILVLVEGWIANRTYR